MRRRSIGVKQSPQRGAAGEKRGIDRATALRYARAVSTRPRSSQGFTRAAQRPRVELPEAGSEQLNARLLIAIAIGSAAAGIALVHLLAARAEPEASVADAGAQARGHAAQEERVPAAAVESPAPPQARKQAPAPPPASEPRVSEPAPAQPPTPVAEARSATGAAAQASAAPAEPEVGPIIARDERALDRPQSNAPAPVQAASEPAQKEAELAPAAPPPNEPAAAAPSSGGIEVVPGYVAYLRCEGLATRSGAFPCPRDRALEKNLRAIVAALDRCSEAAALGRGEFELRIELSAASARPDLDIRAPTEAGKKAVRACAGLAVSRVTTTLRPERMIVSQRFAVR